MTIDWSKAPEGATHWDMGLDGAVAGWMRVNEGQWYWWPVDGAQCERKWHVCLTPKQPKSGKYLARPWNGEGLPPVEAVCEYTLNSGISWFTCVICYIYMDKRALIAKCFTSERSPEFIEQEIPLDDLLRVQFRPIRTADQIEAEQRECAITDMCVLLGKDSTRAGVRAMAGVLYEAGYRKQVAP